jgi:hypothetical protein
VVLVMLFMYRTNMKGDVARMRRSYAKAFGDLLVAALAGLGLSAPLLLPGIQTASISVRSKGTAPAPFPLAHVANVLVAGLQGDDFRTAAYVGPIVVALAIVGTKTAWRRPVTRGLFAVAIVGLVLTFFSPVVRILRLVPSAHTIDWSRSVMMLGFALAILAAMGVQALIENAEPTASVWAAWSFVALAGVLALVALGGVLSLSTEVRQHMGTLVWPAVQCVIGAAGAGWLWKSKWKPRDSVKTPEAHPRRVPPSWLVPTLFLGVLSAFLLSVGIPFWSVSTAYFAPTPAVSTVTHIVGNQLVGYGSCRQERYLTSSPQEVGIRPNANIAYGMYVMAVYDPIVPYSYFQGWKDYTGARTPPSLLNLGIFCPTITNLNQAHLFGIRYVLEPETDTFPGGHVVASAGGEVLYSIPQSAQATIGPVDEGLDQSTGTFGSPVAVTHVDSRTWKMRVSADTKSVLRLRLTNEPGWHASIDGHPLSLSSWAHSMMLEASIPPGRHVVVLSYWPETFTVGLLIAMGTVVLLVCALVFGELRGHRRRAATG